VESAERLARTAQAAGKIWMPGKPCSALGPNLDVGIGPAVDVWFPPLDRASIPGFGPTACGNGRSFCSRGALAARVPYEATRVEAEDGELAGYSAGSGRNRTGYAAPGGVPMWRA